MRFRHSILKMGDQNVLSALQQFTSRKCDALHLLRRLRCEQKQGVCRAEKADALVLRADLFLLAAVAVGVCVSHKPLPAVFGVLADFAIKRACAAQRQ